MHYADWIVSSCLPPQGFSVSQCLFGINVRIFETDQPSLFPKKHTAESRKARRAQTRLFPHSRPWLLSQSTQCPCCDTESRFSPTSARVRVSLLMHGPYKDTPIRLPQVAHCLRPSCSDNATHTQPRCLRRERSAHTMAENTDLYHLQ